jgi:hypothetical protein
MTPATGDEDAKDDEKDEKEGRLLVMPLIAPILFSPASSCQRKQNRLRSSVRFSRPLISLWCALLSVMPISPLKKATVDMAFNAVSELAKTRNTTAKTVDGFKHQLQHY